MNPVDRLASACLAATARRWPDDLSGEMLPAWQAELAALRADRATPAVLRAWRAVTFVASLACSPAVEGAGEQERTRSDRIAAAGRALVGLAGAAGVVLLAAALFDLVHAVNHALAPRVPVAAGVAADLVLLAVAVTVMARIGVLAGRRFKPRLTVVYVVAVGAAAYGFLLAGNRVKMMPFMGWRDIAPGVTAWTALTVAVVWVAARLAAAGRGRAALSAGTAGGLIALTVAGVCASLHASDQLGAGAGWAPAWFALALLPGGAFRFGVTATGSPDGAGAAGAGCCPGTWHTSDILLGNLSAMVGPLLLCTVFVLALVLRAARAVPQETATAGAAAAARQTAAAAGGVRHGLVTRIAAGCAVGVLLLVPTPNGTASLGGVPLSLPLHAALAVAVVALARFDGSGHWLRQAGAWLGLGAGAALLSLVVGQALRGELTAALARFSDNSTVFGFGFLATPAGQLGLAVTLGVLAARWAVDPGDARAATVSPRATG